MENENSEEAKEAEILKVRKEVANKRRNLARDAHRADDEAEAEIGEEEEEEEEGGEGAESVSGEEDGGKGDREALCDDESGKVIREP